MLDDRVFGVLSVKGVRGGDRSHPYTALHVRRANHLSPTNNLFAAQDSVSAKARLRSLGRGEDLTGCSLGAWLETSLNGT